MSKLSRRDFLRGAAVGAAAMAVPGLVARASDSTASRRSTAYRAQRQVVRFTLFGHPQLAEDMVQLFNETHPDIEVRFERSEGQGYGEKILAGLASGQAWDVFRSPNPADALRYGVKGVAADIAPYLLADTQYPADLYLPGALDIYRSGDQLFGLPVWALTIYLYYNKRLFDEAGVAYPTQNTTWEEYVEMLQALTKTDASGNIVQYGANGWGSWTFPVAQDVWSAGGPFYYNEDLTRIEMDDPRTIATLQSEADMMNVLKVHPSPLTPASSPVSLMSGNVATQLDGSWLPWDFREQWREDFDATLTPLRGGNRTNVYYLETFIVNANSPVPVQEAAYKFMAWWAADPASWAIQGKVVEPVVTHMYEDPELAATWLAAPRPQGMIDLAMEHTTQARFWHVEGHATEFENTIYYPEIDRLWRNVAPAEEVCRIITERGNELMQQPLE